MEQNLFQFIIFVGDFFLFRENLSELSITLLRSFSQITIVICLFTTQGLHFVLFPLQHNHHLIHLWLIRSYFSIFLPCLTQMPLILFIQFVDLLFKEPNLSLVILSFGFVKILILLVQLLRPFLCIFDCLIIYLNRFQICNFLQQTLSVGRYVWKLVH